MSREGKYLYCITRGREPRRLTAPGIGGRGDVVHTLHYEDLAAVVSDSPIVEYDNSRRNMIAHTAVLEEAMCETTILPVRFGIIATDEAAIREYILRRRYDELSALLQGMEGRVELGLKAFWREDVIFNEIVDANPSIRQLRDRLAGRSVEETYYERIKLGELVEAAMNRRRNEDADLILNRLRPLAEETRTNQVITEKMVLNAAFLVERDREALFDLAVQQLDSDIGRRMQFKYVGVAPPYNFVNIVVRWS